MRYKILGGAAALLVTALVCASDDPIRPPGPLATDRAPRAAEGPGLPPPPLHDPAALRDDLGWGVDVWKDSYGAAGVAVGLTGGATPLVGEDLLAALDVRSEVVDLLDRDVTLRPGRAWESAPFDTSRFTGIGLKATGEGQVSCRTYWRWTVDEAPLADGPEVLLVSRDAPQTGFGDVLGMEVRITCDTTAAGPATLSDVKLLFRR